MVRPALKIINAEHPEPHTIQSDRSLPRISAENNFKINLDGYVLGRTAKRTRNRFIDSQGELDKLCIEDLVFSGDDSRINFCVKFIVNRYSNISTGTEKHDITVFNTIYIYDLGQENISRGYTLAD